MKSWLVENTNNIIASIIIGIVLACFSGIILDNLITSASSTLNIDETTTKLYIKPLIDEFSKAILMIILLKNLSYKSGLGFGALTGISFGLFNYTLRLFTGCISPIFILMHFITTTISGGLAAFVKKGEITFPIRLAVFLLLMMIIPVMANMSLNQLHFMLQDTKATLCNNFNQTTEQGIEVWNSIVEFFSLP